jgi:hypothetical protein
MESGTGPREMQRAFLGHMQDAKIMQEVADAVAVVRGPSVDDDAGGMVDG